MRERIPLTICYLRYAYEMYHWNNDKTLLELIWPQLVGAAEWQIAVSAQYGIPYKLVATYDVLGRWRVPALELACKLTLTGPVSQTWLGIPPPRTTASFTC